MLTIKFNLCQELNTQPKKELAYWSSMLFDSRSMRHLTDSSTQAPVQLQGRIDLIRILVRLTCKLVSKQSICSFNVGKIENWSMKQCKSARRGARISRGAYQFSNSIGGKVGRESEAVFCATEELPSSRQDSWLLFETGYLEMIGSTFLGKDRC